MGDEEFLDAIQADDAETTPPEPKPEPAPAEEPKTEPEPPAEEAPATTPEPQPETPTPEPPHVPLAAHLDEREKRQRAEAAQAMAEAELQRFRAAQQPQEVPDPDLDPVGFANHQRAELQNALLNERLNFSERFARKDHGAETVEAAKAWAKERIATDPLYRQQLFNDADPYDRLVSDYRRDQLFSQVSDPKEIDEFRAWKAAQAQLAQPPGTVPGTTSPAPTIPAPSLASAPSAGGVLTEPEMTDRDIFEGVIPKG